MPPKHKGQKQQTVARREQHNERKSAVAYTAYSGLNPVFPRLRTRLHYADTFTVTTSVGPGIGNAIFNLNGLFDPDSSGVGHQPMGFDQFSTLYNRYRVFNTHWTIRMSPSASNGAAFHGVVVPVNATSAFTSFVTAAEQTYSKSRIFNSYKPLEIRGNIDMAQLNGKTSEAYASDDTTQAQTNANPTEFLGLHCLVFEPAGAGVAIQYQIHLIFDVEFEDPLVLAQS